MEAAIKKAVDEHGRISGVANCTGSIVLRSAHATSEAEFDQVGAVGQTGWPSPPAPACCTHVECLCRIATPCFALDPPWGETREACTPSVAPPSTLVCPQVMKVNLYSCFNILKPSVKSMMSSGGGSIVFCSSAVARHGVPNHEAIAAAKAGVLGG